LVDFHWFNRSREIKVLSQQKKFVAEEKTKKFVAEEKTKKA